MNSRNCYWADLQIGESLTTKTHEPVSRVQIVKYAGASGDYDPMHVDETAARDAGMPSVHVHSKLVMAFLSTLVTEWMGDAGRLERIAARFVKIVWPTDVVGCHGRVAELSHDSGRYTVSLDLWAENQNGELVVKGSALVRLFHSAEDQARQARGEGPLVIATQPPPPLEDRIGVPLAPPKKRRRSSVRAGKAGKKTAKKTKKAAAKKTKKAAGKKTKKAAAKKTKKAAAGKSKRTAAKKAGKKTAKKKPARSAKTARGRATRRR